MDGAESFLRKSRVRSIWPHSRAGWFAEALEGAVSRGVAFGRAASRPSAFLGVSLVPHCSCYRSVSRLHSGAGRTRVLGRSYQRASNLFSCVIGIPHCACGLVGRRIERSRLRRPHAVGGRVNCAARVKSRSVRVAIGIEMLLRSSRSKA